MVRVSVAVVAIVAIVYIVLFSPIFKIKSAAFTKEQSCLNESSQLDKFSVFGKNIFFLNREKLSLDLKAEFPCIDNARIQKVLPSKLNFDVVTKQPVAKIEGTNLAATKDGLLIQVPQKSQIPTIFLSYDQNVQVASKIVDEKVLFALQVAASLLKSDFVPQNIRILDLGDVAVYGNYNIVAIFSSSKDVDVQLDSLQSVLARSKIDAAKIAKIDLRFNNPSIIYK